MLEQIFTAQNQETTDSTDSPNRTTKRRKTDSDADDETGPYFGQPAGKKAKGGTGYDGETSEDVGFEVLLHTT